MPGKVTTGSPSMILWTGTVTPEVSIPIATDWYVKDGPLLETGLAEVTVAGTLPGENTRLTEDPLLTRGCRNLCPAFDIVAEEIGVDGEKLDCTSPIL